MPWSDYEVKQRKRENRNVNVIEKNGAEKLLQTSSILITILLKFGDMVDVAFDDIDESYEMLVEWKLFKRIIWIVTVKSVK